MNNVKIFPLVAITLSASTPFLANGELTTNSSYIREFVSTDNGVATFDLTFYDQYITNSTSCNCINTLSTAYTAPEVESLNTEKQENLAYRTGCRSAQY